MCCVRGGGEASEHVHEGGEERGGEEGAAGGQELAQADLTMGGPGGKGRGVSLRGGARGVATHLLWRLDW